MKPADALVESLLENPDIKIEVSKTFATEYTVVAKYRGRQAAKASVKLIGKNRLRMAGITVDEEFRRKGIATAIYRHLEKMTDRTFQRGLKPTRDGSAFWNSPKRSWGDPVK